MCLLQINKKDCLHCGKGHADYCEKCYQDLIGENAVLQLEKSLKDQKINALRGTIEQIKKYIIDLEYIRDCYYKEIKNRKIFKLDTEKKASECEKMSVINNEILKRANKVELYEKETQWLEKYKEMPIILQVSEKEYKELKILSETYDNITYNTSEGIYIE